MSEPDTIIAATSIDTLRWFSMSDDERWQYQRDRFERWEAAQLAEEKEHARRLAEETHICRKCRWLVRNTCGGTEVTAPDAWLSCEHPKPEAWVVEDDSTHEYDGLACPCWEAIPDAS